MLDRVVIEPMTESFILWRCLHSGPLSKTTIDLYPPERQVSQDNGKTTWSLHRAINVPLLKKIIRTYGTCAILARDGDNVVGFLRFYPKILYALDGAGELCLQQAYPAGPTEHLVDTAFPSIDDIQDRTLMVYCLMTGSPFQDSNPYRRKGIGTRMGRELIQWARDHGWTGIEAKAHEDLDIMYAVSGQAGKRFWQNLGFTAVKKEVAHDIPEFHGEFLATMQEQAVKKGLRPEDAVNQYTMRMDLS